MSPDNGFASRLSFSQSPWDAVEDDPDATFTTTEMTVLDKDGNEVATIDLVVTFQL